MSAFDHFFIGVLPDELPVLVSLTEAAKSSDFKPEFDVTLLVTVCKDGVFTVSSANHVLSCTEETVTFTNNQSLRIWKLEGSDKLYLNLSQFIQLVKHEFIVPIQRAFNDEYGERGYHIAQVGYNYRVVKAIMLGDEQLLEKAAQQKGVDILSMKAMAPKDNWETLPLVGKTVAGIVYLDDGVVKETSEYCDDLLILFTDGEIARYTHDASCCERVYLSDIEGDINDLIGQTLTRAEKVSRISEDNTSSWTFYRFETAKGGLVIRWCGESNGYYSIDVDEHWGKLTTPFDNSYSHEVYLHLNRLVYGAGNEYERKIEERNAKRRAEMEGILQARINKAKLTFMHGSIRTDAGDYVLSDDIALRVMEELFCNSNPTQSLEWFIDLFGALRINPSSDQGIMVLKDHVAQFDTIALAKFLVRKDLRREPILHEMIKGQ